MRRRRFQVTSGREAELFSSAFYRFLERELESLGQADHCSLHAEPGLGGASEMMSVDLWDETALDRFERYWRDFRREHLARLDRLRETLRPYPADALVQVMSAPAAMA